MPRLSQLDKLQLLATGLSQRSIAAALGVSPRSVGRYLRGERVIPATVGGAVRYVFDQYRDVQREQAREAGIPWTGFPVAAQRTVRADNTPGRSVKYLRPDLMSDELRERWLRALYQTQKVGAVSVGSRFDAYVYTKTKRERERRGGMPQFRTDTNVLYDEYRGKRKQTALGRAHGRKMDVFSSPTAFAKAGNEDRAIDQVNAVLRAHADRATPRERYSEVADQTLGHTLFFDLAGVERERPKLTKRMRAKGRR